MSSLRSSTASLGKDTGAVRGPEVRQLLKSHQLNAAGGKRFRLNLKLTLNNRESCVILGYVSVNTVSDLKVLICSIKWVDGWENKTGSGQRSKISVARSQICNYLWLSRNYTGCCFSRTKLKVVLVLQHFTQASSRLTIITTTWLLFTSCFAPFFPLINFPIRGPVEVEYLVIHQMELDAI